MPLVQPTSIINEMEMHEYIFKYDALKTFFMSALSASHPFLCALFLYGDLNGTELEK